VPDLAAANLPERDRAILAGAGEQTAVRAVGDLQDHRIGLDRAPQARPARRQSEGLGERPGALERAVAARRFDREQEALLDPLDGLLADLGGLGGKLAGKRDLGLPLGAGALGDRLDLPLARQIALMPGDAGGGNGTDQHGREGRHGDPAPPPQLVMLTDVLANQIVLGNPPNGGGDAGDRVAKARVAPVEARLCFGPAQIEPERLLGEDAGKATRQCRADLPIEVACGIIPGQFAVRLDQEDSLV
jgi:hypothetical protein